MWQKAVRTFWGSPDKADETENKAVSKIGAENFWPSSVDKESYKAARILRSFCQDGVYEEIGTQPQNAKQHEKVMKKIPVAVIKNAKGLAIFTTMRSGLWYSGAGGSGILVSRMADDTWSPPSAILLHTAGTGFLVGVDICDCILVLNTREAVDAFAKWRLTLGGAMSVIAGPLGVDGIAAIPNTPASVFTYLRSRGYHAGAQIDGTVIVQRSEENEKYYGYKYSASEIVSGKVRNPPSELRTLWQTLKAAQGDLDVDHSAIPTEPSPADLEVVNSDYVFGVPDREDPDPFGVLALEKEGLQIREAGTKTAVPTEAFEFRPNPTSPIFDTYNTRTFEKENPDSRRSSWREKQDSKRNSIMDKQDSRRSSWRDSALTLGNMDRHKSVTMDISTQTDFDGPVTPGINDFARALKMEKNNLPSTPSGLPGTPPSLPQTPPLVPSKLPASTPGFSATTSSQPPLKRVSMVEKNASSTFDHHVSTSVLTNTNNVVATAMDRPSLAADYDEDEDEDDGEDDDEEEPVIIEEVHQAARPQTVFKPRVVTIPKHLRPELPSRNPSRVVQRPASMQSLPGDDTQSIDQASTTSVRSSSVSYDGHQRNESITSIGSARTEPSSPSFRSIRLDNKVEEIKEGPSVALNDVDNESSPPPQKVAAESGVYPVSSTQAPQLKTAEPPTVAGVSEITPAIASATTGMPPVNNQKATSKAIESMVPLSPSRYVGKSEESVKPLSPTKGPTSTVTKTTNASPLKNDTGPTRPTTSMPLSPTKITTPMTSTAASTLALAKATSSSTVPTSPSPSKAPGGRITGTITSSPPPKPSIGLPSTASKTPAAQSLKKGPGLDAGNTAAPIALKDRPVKAASANSRPSSPAPPKKAPTGMASTTPQPPASNELNKPVLKTSDPLASTASKLLAASPISTASNAAGSSLTTLVADKPIALVNKPEDSGASKAKDTNVPLSVSQPATASTAVEVPPAPTPISIPISAQVEPSTTKPEPAAEVELATTLPTDDIEVPPPPSPSDVKTSAPRISLLGMKFSLDDDDKSDNDDDGDDGPPAASKALVDPTFKGRLHSLDYGYKEDFS